MRVWLAGGQAEGRKQGRKEEGREGRERHSHHRRPWCLSVTPACPLPSFSCSSHRPTFSFSTDLLLSSISCHRSPPRGTQALAGGGHDESGIVRLLLPCEPCLWVLLFLSVCLSICCGRSLSVPCKPWQFVGRRGLRDGVLDLLRLKLRERSCCTLLDLFLISFPNYTCSKATAARYVISFLVPHAQRNGRLWQPGVSCPCSLMKDRKKERTALTRVSLTAFLVIGYERTA